MNPAPEGYRSSFETAKEQATPQPTQTATPKPTEEPFTGFYDTEAMTLKERIHTPEGFHRVPSISTIFGSLSTYG